MHRYAFNAADVRRIIDWIVRSDVLHSTIADAVGRADFDPGTGRFHVDGVGWCSMDEIVAVKLGLCGPPSTPDDEDPSDYGG